MRYLLATLLFVSVVHAEEVCVNIDMDALESVSAYAFPLTSEERKTGQPETTEAKLKATLEHFIEQFYERAARDKRESETPSTPIINRGSR